MQIYWPLLLKFIPLANKMSITEPSLPLLFIQKSFSRHEKKGKTIFKWGGKIGKLRKMTEKGLQFDILIHFVIFYFQDFCLKSLKRIWNISISLLILFFWCWLLKSSMITLFRTSFNPKTKIFLTGPYHQWAIVIFKTALKWTKNNID